MSTYQSGFGVAEAPGITYEDLLNREGLKRGPVDPLQATLRGLASDPFIKALNGKQEEIKKSGLDAETIAQLTRAPKSATVAPQSAAADQDQKMYYAGIYAAVSEEVNNRLAIAERASALDLPDHAIWILQKAFDYAESNIQQVESDIEQKPSPIGTALLSQLNQLKSRVVTKMQSILTRHGGPHLSKDELTSMLTRDKGAAPEQGPAAKAGNQDAQKPESQAKGLEGKKVSDPKASEKNARNIGSATGKIAGAIPEILNGVVQDLEALTKNKDATAATAWTVVYNALTKLELARALMRISVVGGNLLKQGAAAEANVDQHKDTIDNLEQASYKVYHAIKNRETGGAPVQPDSLKDQSETAQEPGISGAVQTKGPKPSRAFLQVMNPYQMDYLKNTSSYSPANGGNGLGMAMLGNTSRLEAMQQGGRLSAKAAF